MHAVEHCGLRLVRHSKSYLQLLHVLDHHNGGACCQKVQQDESDVSYYFRDRHRLHVDDVPAHEHLQGQCKRSRDNRTCLMNEEHDEETAHLQGQVHWILRVLNAVWKEDYADTNQ